MILQYDLDEIHRKYDKVASGELSATHDECVGWMEVFREKMKFASVLFGETVWRDGWKVMWISDSYDIDQELSE